MLIIKPKEILSIMIENLLLPDIENGIASGAPWDQKLQQHIKETVKYFLETELGRLEMDPRYFELHAEKNSQLGYPIIELFYADNCFGYITIKFQHGSLKYTRTGNELIDGGINDKGNKKFNETISY